MLTTRNMAMVARIDDPVLAARRRDRVATQPIVVPLFLWFALVYSPFFLNDLLFIRITDWRYYLLVDYGTRFVVIGLLLAVRPLRTITVQHESLTIAPSHVAILTVGCVAFWALLRGGFDPLLNLALGDTSLAHWPTLPPGIKQFDLFVGMALVALSEELMSRRCAKHVLRAYLRHDGLVILVSALLFGAMHWSGGIAHVISATLIGGILMAVYLRVGALWPTVVAHYVIDVIAFW
jgi:membrane protease YdiL (CAAX protease family)